MQNCPRLPVVDGYIWSKAGEIAGMRFEALVNGKEVLLKGGDPHFTNKGTAAVHISWPLTTVRGSLEKDLSEGRVNIKLVSNARCSWYLDLNTFATAQLPFIK
ncbi:hypothetical protein [Mucilaginibacter sp. AK015]|uniref:hypothetical protein n=1 Tax=Mucilaginibacter sp. AK015 TaxID=2723072 RepID=UPI00160A4419|nr:hypothetical protein [Mucilaginibacter sp. AK015]MBB5395647.1 hypothetical protein [Mucilaginibacter sp. AK015]